jgi:hypothetical protein
MSCSGEFEGSILLDGEVRSRGVRVWMSDTNLALSPLGLSRFEIILFPFNLGMIFAQSEREIREGQSFDFKGKRLGAVSEGPLGHPGDGEYNCRNIIAFRANTTYFPDRMEVEVEGETASGTDYFDASKILPPLTFSVQFAIPKDRYVDFFQLKDHVHANLLKVLDRVFP